MPKQRLNRMIQLLEEGKTVFGPGVIRNGNFEEIISVADSDYDFIIIEMEHEAFDFTLLRASLQFMLNRKEIAGKGNLQPNCVPLVRIPPNARERNQWVIKQTLDNGAYGILVPHVNTVEDAVFAVQAARYTQARGVPDERPEGQRGWWPGTAPRYWGLSGSEYFEAADVWPLDPDGNVLVMAIIEEPLAIKNLRDILKQCKGIGAVWAGPGDLSVAMGLKGQTTHPEVEEAVLKILATCKESNVPCMFGATTPQDVEKRMNQGFRIITARPTRSLANLQQGRKLSGRA